MSAKEFGEEVKRAQDQAAGERERQQSRVQTIDACTFQLSNDIASAVKIALREFNAPLKAYPTSCVDEFVEGGANIVMLGRSRRFPALRVTATINASKECIEVTVERITETTTSELPTLTFPLEIENEWRVRIRDGRRFIRDSEFAGRLIGYFRD